MAEKGKVVVIGLDGASFNVIDPMIQSGELPNLARLMEEGARGELRSTFPPITHAAWSSFSTGKNPGRHGVMDFIEPPYWNDERQSFQFTNFSSIKTPTFWQTLRGSGVRVGIVNLPMTFPPQELDGFLVGGIDTPSENSRFTWPDDLIEKLREAGIHYRPDYVEILKYEGGEARMRAKQEVIDDYFHIEEERRKTILHLMENEPWDLLVVVIGITDRIAHHFWEDHEAGLRGEHNRFEEVVRDSYRLADRVVGDMLERLDDEIPVMVMSDHGFGTFDGLFFVNNWLRKEGFLALRPTRISNLKETWRWLRVKKSLRQMLRFLRLGPLARLLPTALADRQWNLTIPFPVVSPARVDWTRTRAYSGAFGIYVNLEGRTERGSVPQEEYEQVREAVMERLRALRDPDSGEPLVERVWKKEEVLDGEFLDQAPDIYFETRQGRILPTSTWLFRRSLKRKVLGNHKMEGIFLLRAPQVKKGARVVGAKIEDCMSNVFYLMGREIPEDYDGRVLEEIYDSAFLETHPPRKGPPTGGVGEEGGEKKEYSSEDEELIRSRLRSLGYID